MRLDSKLRPLTVMQTQKQLNRTGLPVCIKESSSLGQAKLIKSDIKEIYNVTKDFNLNKFCSFNSNYISK